jgi:uncharacterized membrane protein (UPF0127 family)
VVFTHGMPRPRLTLALALAWILAVSGGACSTGDQAEPSTRTGLPTGTLSIRTGAREVSLSVEIADTQQARSTGLMRRRNLAADAGMVFLFQAPTDGPFWMKGTLIPLSIAFWDAGDRIVAILDMEPCRANPCPLYSPGVSYVAAVEVNQGWLEAHGVAVGDTVELER